MLIPNTDEVNQFLTDQGIDRGYLNSRWVQFLDSLATEDISTYPVDQAEMTFLKEQLELPNSLDHKDSLWDAFLTEAGFPEPEDPGPPKVRAKGRANMPKRIRDWLAAGGNPILGGVTNSALGQWDGSTDDRAYESYIEDGDNTDVLDRAHDSQMFLTFSYDIDRSSSSPTVLYDLYLGNSGDTEYGVSGDFHLTSASRNTSAILRQNQNAYPLHYADAPHCAGSGILWGMEEAVQFGGLDFRSVNNNFFYEGMVYFTGEGSTVSDFAVLDEVTLQQTGTGGGGNNLEAEGYIDVFSLKMPVLNTGSWDFATDGDPASDDGPWAPFDLTDNKPGSIIATTSYATVSSDSTYVKPTFKDGADDLNAAGDWTRYARSGSGNLYTTGYDGAATSIFTTTSYDSVALYLGHDIDDCPTVAVGSWGNSASNGIFPSHFHLTRGTTGGDANAALDEWRVPMAASDPTGGVMSAVRYDAGLYKLAEYRSATDGSQSTPIASTSLSGTGGMIWIIGDNVDDSCFVELSYDNGATWETTIDNLLAQPGLGSWTYAETEGSVNIVTGTDNFTIGLIAGHDIDGAKTWGRYWLGTSTLHRSHLSKIAGADGDGIATHIRVTASPTITGGDIYILAQQA